MRWGRDASLETVIESVVVASELMLVTGWTACGLRVMMSLPERRIGQPWGRTRAPTQGPWQGAEQALWSAPRVSAPRSQSDKPDPLLASRLLLAACCGLDWQGLDPAVP